MYKNDSSDSLDSLDSHEEVAGINNTPTTNRLQSKVVDALEKDPNFKGKIFYPNTNPKEYEADIYHWSASSTQRSICTIRPSTTEDVSKILKLIGQYREGFAVKSGGHIANPGFSSSTNILISMVNFNKIDYQRNSETVVIGTGQIWDNVYKELEKQNPPRCALGARVSNIGVAGFLLGGGYSWQTNQYGLAMDSVVEYELVKPDGSVVKVSPTVNSNLYFALRGGGNNFGIITQVTLKTFVQKTVWGGKVFYSGSIFRDAKIKRLFRAAQNFINIQNQYPKAAMLVSLGVIPSRIIRVINIILFYDGETYPDGIFNEFIALVKEFFPDKSKSWKARTFSDLVGNAMPYELSKDYRGVLHTIPVSQYTSGFLDAIVKESENLPNDRKFPAKVYQLNYSVEPFLFNILSHSKINSAYPSDRSFSFSPFAVYVSWAKANESSDKDMQDFIKYASERIIEEARRNGISTRGALYPNYALFDSKLEDIYGSNLNQLKSIKKAVDPNDVMGLAGGFKIKA